MVNGSITFYNNDVMISNFALISVFGFNMPL